MLASLAVANATLKQFYCDFFNAKRLSVNSYHSQ